MFSYLQSLTFFALFMLGSFICLIGKSGFHSHLFSALSSIPLGSSKHQLALASVRSSLALISGICSYQDSHAQMSCLHHLADLRLRSLTQRCLIRGVMLVGFLFPAMPRVFRQPFLLSTSPSPIRLPSSIDYIDFVQTSASSTLGVFSIPASWA
jgi:hypothetical protein